MLATYPKFASPQLSSLQEKNRPCSPTLVIPSQLLIDEMNSAEDHANFESLSRNRISNISFAVCSAGEILILAVMVGIVKAMHAEDSTENNTKTFSVLTAFSGGVWRTCLFFCPHLVYHLQMYFQSSALSPGSLLRSVDLALNFHREPLSLLSD